MACVGENELGCHRLMQAAPAHLDPRLDPSVVVATPSITSGTAGGGPNIGELELGVVGACYRE